MFVQVVQHLPQPLHSLLVWLQEHGLEVHRQPVPEGEQITVFQKAASETASDRSGDCTLKQTPQKPAELWYESRRWRLHWSSLWAIEQVDPAKVSTITSNYLELAFKDATQQKKSRTPAYYKNKLWWMCSNQLLCSSQLWPQEGNKQGLLYTRTHVCYLTDLFLVHAALVGIHHVCLPFRLL